MTLEECLNHIRQITDDHAALCPDVELRFNDKIWLEDQRELGVVGSVRFINTKRFHECRERGMDGVCYGNVMNITEDGLKYAADKVYLSTVADIMKRTQALSSQVPHSLNHSTEGCTNGMA